MRPLKFLLVTAVLEIASVSAQQQPVAEATEFRKPGDVIRFDIKFSGPDADKIRTASLYLGLAGGGASTDQPGFSQGFGGPPSRQTAPRVFSVNAPVPDVIASGNYTVYINVQTDTGTGFQYASGNQFETPLIHIRNDRTFRPPQITVSELGER